jgi:SAM-dependent methyltransferase
MAIDYEWTDSEGFAQFYESYFVPALFGDWGELTVSAGKLQAGERVLDVACGTGVVARCAGRFTESVVGVDLSDDMLSVAAKMAPAIKWQKGDAQQLPFDDGTFDVVFSQFALMFFSDQIAALKEMRRVGGRVVVTVWDALERSPGYREFVYLLNRDCGPDPAAVLSSPFNLGDTKKLASLFETAGLTLTIETKQTIARFPSIEGWVTTDVRATPMSDMFDDSALKSLIESAKVYLSEYENDDGTVSFPAPAHIVTCE